MAGPYLFGALVAGLVAYVVIKLFLGYLENEQNTTMPFIIYRILLGVALLVLASTEIGRAGVALRIGFTIAEDLGMMDIEA